MKLDSRRHLMHRKMKIAYSVLRGHTEKSCRQQQIKLRGDRQNKCLPSNKNGYSIQNKYFLLIKNKYASSQDTPYIFLASVHGNNECQCNCVSPDDLQSFGFKNINMERMAITALCIPPQYMI